MNGPSITRKGGSTSTTSSTSSGSSRGGYGSDHGSSAAAAAATAAATAATRRALSPGRGGGGGGGGVRRGGNGSVSPRDLQEVDLRQLGGVTYAKVATGKAHGSLVGSMLEELEGIAVGKKHSKKVRALLSYQ